MNTGPVTAGGMLNADDARANYQALANLADTIVQILNSDPGKLRNLVDPWSAVHDAVVMTKDSLSIQLTNVEDNSSGAMANQLTGYQRELLNGLQALVNATDTVSNGLNTAAGALAKVRQSLATTLFGAPYLNPTSLKNFAQFADISHQVSVGTAVQNAILHGHFDFNDLYTQINKYHNAMTALLATLKGVKPQLDAMRSKKGGGLPDAPAVRPDDSTAPATPNSTPPGGGSAPGSGGQDPGPGSGTPGSGTPGSSDPGSGDPGSGDPGSGDPGSGDPGSGDPGSGDPGTDDGSSTPMTPSSLTPDTSDTGLGSSPDDLAQPPVDPSLSSSLPSTMDPTTGLSPYDQGSTLSGTSTPASSTFTPSTFTPSTFAPSTFTPSTVTPNASSSLGGNESTPATSFGAGSGDAGEPPPTLAGGAVPGGSSSTTTAGGFYPPMMPPMGAGGRGSAGVKPGEAGSRGGAALRPGGRDGRRAALRPQLAGRSMDEDERPAEAFAAVPDGELLDEELWQVPGATPAPAPPELGRRGSSRGA